MALPLLWRRVSCAYDTPEAVVRGVPDPAPRTKSKRCIVGLDLGKMDPAFGKPIVGCLLIASGWIGVHAAGAVACNTAFGKAIHPTPALFVK